MKEVGLGLLGLDPTSFYSYTIDELAIAADAKAAQIEREERGAWERSRFVAFALLQPNLKKGTTLKATDLVTFPWEKKKKPKLSKEELRKKLEERDLL